MQQLSMSLRTKKERMDSYEGQGQTYIQHGVASYMGAYVYVQHWMHDRLIDTEVPETEEKRTKQIRPQERKQVVEGRMCAGVYKTVFIIWYTVPQSIHASCD